MVLVLVAFLFAHTLVFTSRALGQYSYAHVFKTTKKHIFTYAPLLNLDSDLPPTPSVTPYLPRNIRVIIPYLDYIFYFCHFWKACIGWRGETEIRGDKLTSPLKGDKYVRGVKNVCKNLKNSCK